MEKNKQKIILIGIVVILLLTSAFAIFLSLQSSNDNPPIDSNEGNIPSLNKEIVRLTNESLFFGVQDAVNSYYRALVNNNNLEVYYLLEDEYKENNGLTTANAATRLNEFTNSPTFIAEEIYYNPNSKTTYFFASGYTKDIPIMEGEVKYYAKINFLVIKDENNKYVIRPLDNNLNIESYAESYNIKEVLARNDTSFKTSELENKYKVTYYINTFQDLLYLDPKKAYNLLDSEKKEFFTNYQSEDGYNETLFLEYRDTIAVSLTKNYNTLDTSIKNGEKIYHETDADGDSITIREKAIMDFQIGFDFGW